jgi:ankyrin repeat protein
MSQDLNKSLIQAAEGGDLTTVQAMLAQGADPNAMGPLSAALHCAAFEGHLEIVTTLLQGGSNPNLADIKGLYPLQLAASKGRMAIAQALIAAGADLEARTRHGGTALHVAAASDFPDMVQLLLAAGAAIEARDAGGNTPLATACGLGAKPSFDVLRKAGADMRTLSDGQETLLIKAARGLRSLRVKKWFGQDTTQDVPVTYTLRNGVLTATQNGVEQSLNLEAERFVASQPWGPKGHLAYLNAIEIVRFLLAAGFDPNARDADGHTALSLICHVGEAALIELLFAAGAQPEIQHGEGFQPIHLVAGSERLDGLQRFLAMAPTADVNARDAYGWTPLHWLADMGGDVKMAHLLLQRQADPVAKSTRARGADMPAGMTPADVAAHWGDAAMAAALQVG